MNFSYDYYVTCVDFTSYLKMVSREDVKELNLTSCYWLRWPDLRTLIPKLVNLEALHVADTVISTERLVKLLPSLPKVYYHR